MIAPTTAAEAVAQGAQLLDQRMPGWYKLIDLKKLDLSCCTNCVCGQLGEHLMGEQIGGRYSDFYFEYLDMGLTPSNLYGFNEYHAWDDAEERVTLHIKYRELDQEWANAIRSRLDADKLAQPVKEKETVLA